MEHEDIGEVVEWWARSAELSREGGFDGTEVHIAHSYLLHQFLSPLYNKRDDEYGGSFENRLRFAREVIDAVREPGRRTTGSSASADALGLRPGRPRHRGRAGDGAPARGAGGLDYVNVTAAGYHNISRRSSPRTCPTATSSI